MLAQQMFYYEDNVDSILVFYNKWEKEAEKQKNIELQGNIKYFTLAAVSNRDRKELFLTLIYPSLDFLKKHERWQYYDYLQNALFRIYIRDNKYVEAIQHAKALHEETKLSQRKEGIAVAHRMLAVAYLTVGRYADSEEHGKMCVEILESLDHPHPLLQDAYIVWVDALNYQKKYDETLNALKLWEVALEQLGHDAITMYDFYWISAIAYIDMGDLVKGEAYMLKADSIEASHFHKPRHSRDLFWAKIKEGRKEYAQALDLINASYPDISSDIEILPVKARLLCKMGRGIEAYPLYEHLQEVKDSLQKNYFNVQLDELRTQYEVDKHIAEKERNRNYFLFALGGCVLLLIVLGIWISYSRAIVKKNRGLYLQIKEQDRLASELEAMTKHYEEVAPLIPPESDVETRLMVSLPGTHQQRQFVSRLRNYLLENKYYTTFDIDIQELTSKMATNRTSLFEALKAVTGKTPMEFINDLRLDEAKRLLDDSNLTIETIAIECGFYTARTFYRQFRERYRISPTEYRKIAGEQR
ncbi:MAG: helix-turn-helix domain-containing protein [Lentimicrobiaceae bacterium]|nr:helix-turn-helix domain-containing protein [Lentimicrobiaceae bacterium]